jgi:uncharacterized membrane protein SpoIIM required for sporulation
MLGSFQYFFYDYGALKDSARGIWLHGVFEIFAMVVEAMCGLILGASICFLRTFSRFNSFKKGFKDSFKIFLSTVPFTICAGIIEGYVTRHALRMPLTEPIDYFYFTCHCDILLFCVSSIVNKKTNKQINDTIL